MASSSSPGYSPREEIANTATHGVGVLLSVVGTVFLTIAAAEGGTLAFTACLIFGATLVALYTASTLYHAVPGAHAKSILRIIDHAAIYLLIAGTYTPLCLVGIGGVWGWALVGTVWSLAGVGVATTVVAMHRLKVLSMVLYLVMGWLVLVAAHRMVSCLAPAELTLLLVGGVCYTGGLAFYGWRSLPFSHSVWHFFVLAGSVLHFFAVWLVISV